nr:reverse transcriptase [Tanacetum cinerariifolium]
DRLKHQGYIGEEPLKHWKKNGELCKLEIINPDITIEDRPLKHVTPAMENLFKEHVDSLLKIGAIRPSKRFHQVAVDEESILWTAFLVPGGLYEWLVMPFGACKAPWLRLIPTKMKIAVSTIDFLGVVIGEGTIKLQPYIIKKIVNFNEEELKTKKGLRWMHGRMGRNSQMEKEKGRSKRMHRRNEGISCNNSSLSGESSIVPQCLSKDYEDHLRRSHEDFQPLPRIFTHEEPGALYKHYQLKA